MTRRFASLVFVVVIAVVVVLVGSGCAARETIRPSVATVNGSALSQADLDLELEAIVGNGPYLETIEAQGNTVRGTGSGTYDLAFVTRVLTRQIYLQLVHRELVKRKLRPTAADRAQAESEVVADVGGEAIFSRFPAAYRDVLILRSAEVSTLARDLSGVDADDTAVRKFYDDNPGLFSETCVAHILFTVVGEDGQPDFAAVEAQAASLTAEAEGARQRIVSGSITFAAAAAEVSDDSSNKEQGGDLECGPAGRFVPEFETAMDTLRVGEVSAPVRTQFGAHLITVSSRGPKPFEAAEEEVRQRVLADAQQPFADFLQAAVAGANISVNPRYGRFDRDGPSPAVVPPAGPPPTAVDGPVPPESPPPGIPGF